MVFMMSHSSGLFITKQFQKNMKYEQVQIPSGLPLRLQSLRTAVLLRLFLDMLSKANVFGTARFVAEKKLLVC